MTELNGSIIYIKVINGQDVIGTIINENVTNEKIILYIPAVIIADVDGTIDSNNLYIEDWLPGNDSKFIILTMDKILDILTPSKHALEVYNKYLDTLDDIEKTNIVSIDIGRKANPQG